jgi:hypothetical protein
MIVSGFCLLTEHLVAREDSVWFYPLYASCVGKGEMVDGPLPSDDYLFVDKLSN